MRHKLLLIALSCVVLPFMAYIAGILGYWAMPLEFDLLAHPTVSFGLALGVGYLWRRIGISHPYYWSIIIPVLLIGAGWELWEFWFYRDLFVNYSDSFKDLLVDAVGAMVGAFVFKNKPM